MDPASLQIADNLARVRERIERAARRSGRSRGHITLIAVSKTHPPAKIRALYQAGIRDFGENRVQERDAKESLLADLDITWHMIGHLQTNKAARAVSLFHTIDSVDNIGLADKLNRAYQEALAERARANLEKAQREPVRRTAAASTRIRALIEVKVDPEPAKSGVDAPELPRMLEALAHLPHLDVRGLMSIPPYFDDPEAARPYFRRLRELRDSLCAKMPSTPLPVLSMGMSHDFEVAIEEGATEIRVGTALFGERETA
jgi:PLP dependent protein